MRHFLCRGAFALGKPSCSTTQSSAEVSKRMAASAVAGCSPLASAWQRFISTASTHCAASSCTSRSWPATCVLADLSSWRQLCSVLHKLANPADLGAACGPHLPGRLLPYLEQQGHVRANSCKAHDDHGLVAHGCCADAPAQRVLHTNSKRQELQAATQHARLDARPVCWVARCSEC